MRCLNCKKFKTKKNTKYFKDGKKWRLYYLCKVCENTTNAAHRADQANRAQYILKDSRASDKREGRSNDLTLEFVKTALDKPCVYCGDHTLQKTLDRVDNTKGHTQDNVESACIRCNLFLRRDMPYEAWLLFRGIVRQARMRGLFGDWGTAVRRKDAR